MSSACPPLLHYPELSIYHSMHVPCTKTQKNKRIWKLKLDSFRQGRFDHNPVEGQSPKRDTRERVLNPLILNTYCTLTIQIACIDKYADRCNHLIKLIYSTLYTLYSILYTLYSILCTLYSILHTLHSILYTLYSILYTLYSILYTLYSLLYTLHSILYTLYSILYTLYSILYTLHSIP